MATSVIIRAGVVVVDGTGALPRRADVEDGDRIGHVSDVLGMPDAEVLNATCHTVTAGFVKRA